MLQTDFGAFDGNSWERLCQTILKNKYIENGYQEMPASPGDYGIEGFVTDFGYAYQCYCPDTNLDKKSLYEKQRDKISTDLKKLKTYRQEIKSRIGDRKIKRWVFLSPIINMNDLLAHVKKKQQEVLGWKLDIIDDDFQIYLHDADFYVSEIHKIRAVGGEKISFIGDCTDFSFIDIHSDDAYQQNINRKNSKRCKQSGDDSSTQLKKLNEITIKNLIKGASFMSKVEKESPDVYFHLSRVIAQYEDEVEENCITWSGKAEELIKKVRGGLIHRISEEIPSLSASDRSLIARLLTSQWLAVCPLDINDD